MRLANVTSMRLSIGVAAIALGVAAPATAIARTSVCEPVHVSEAQRPLPAPWREALDALVRATAQEGQPWSCPGGTVVIVLDDRGAVLTLTDAHGRSASRPVPSPEEIVPTGEALLAVPGDDHPAPAPPPPAPPPPPPPLPEHEPPPAPHPPPADPRLLIEALAGVRISAPATAGWMTTRLGAVLPLGEWSVGMYARYDMALAGPRATPAGFDMDAVSAGFSLGRRLLRDPFDLRVTLDPTLSVVMMEAGQEDQIDHPEGARVAFRIGTSARGSFHLAGAFRGLILIDGELSPAGVAGWRKIHPSLPATPVYTAGVLLGVEAIIR